MINELENYYSTLNEPNRSCMLALRSIILAQDTNIVETQKFGMPCFCYGRKPLCYLWTDRKNGNKPYILMVDGKLLDHPQLETGNRSRMKIFRIEPEEDIPVETIQIMFNDALQLHRKLME